MKSMVSDQSTLTHQFATVADQPAAGLTVALFVTCINDVMRPGTGVATVEILERLGAHVVFPKAQTCCGQIFTNTGYFNEAMGSVRSYVKAFSNYDYVVVPSGSCTLSVREQHPMLARRTGDAALIDAVRHTTAITFDLPEFLVNVLHIVDVGAYFPHTVTWHTSCHGLQGLRDSPAQRALLDHVRGLTRIELPASDQCCGFGGTFSVKNPDVSAAMANDKARHVRETGAEYVVANDNSCLLNIGGVLDRQNSGVKSIHLAEILASTEQN